MDFSARHIGPSPAEQEQMLAAVGYSSLDDLTTAALPPALAGTGAGPLNLPAPRSEAEAEAELRRLAGRNTVLTSMIGLGYYPTITPAVIRRSSSSASASDRGPGRSSGAAPVLASAGGSAAAVSSSSEE